MSHRRGVQQSVLSLMVRKKYRRKLRPSMDLQTNLTSQLITGEVDNSTLDTIAQRPNITLGDESPELKELLDAIIAREEGKALGRCGIPAEIWKHVRLASSLYKLSLQIWENEEIPKDWKDAIIVPVFKNGRRLWEGLWELSTCFSSLNSRKDLCSHTPQQTERTHCSPYRA